MTNIFAPTASPIMTTRETDPEKLMEKIGDWEPAPGRDVIIKPLVLGGEDYGVFEMTPWEDFVDDLARYGVRVSAYNVWWNIRHNGEESQD